MTKLLSDTFKKVGIISDAHGIRGEVYVILFSGDNSWVENLKEIKIKSTPFNSKTAHNKTTEKNLEIQKIKSFKKGFICSFSNIKTRNQAEELKKMEVWIQSDMFISQDGEQPFLAELLGFEVFDSTQGLIGKVNGFSSNGDQDLLVLDKSVNNQKIEIPFVKQFVNLLKMKNEGMKNECRIQMK